MAAKKKTSDDTGDLLRGEWHEAGERMFPGWESLRCRRFVWRTPKKFEIAFLVPIEPGSRRFFAEPLLDAWQLRRAPVDFVDQVCTKGLSVLAKVNQYEVAQTAEGTPPVGLRPGLDVLRFYLEVFKLRRIGKEAVNRKLSKRDLLTNGHEEGACLIPGASLKAVQQRSAADIVRFFGNEYLKAVEETPKPRKLVSTAGLLAPLVGFAGQAFIDGIDNREWDPAAFRSTWRAIASTVVAGLNMFEDQEWVLGQQSEFRDFVARLYEGWQEKGEDGFAKWAAGERLRKWHRLLVGYHEVVRRARCKLSPSGAMMDDLKERATRYYRVLLWLSHAHMGLAYGAVMTAAWTTFCDSMLISPTYDERRVFRLLNAPQRSLAGLPLAFVPLEPLTWIMPFLVDQLNDVGGDDLERVTSDVLGIYAATVAEVQQRDRDRKKSQLPGDIPAWSMPSRGVGRVDKDIESGRTQVDRAVFDAEPTD